MEKNVIAYKSYFFDFMETLTEKEALKVYYALDMLKTQDKVSKKFVQHLINGLFEIRIEYNSNIYRVFFCFDNEKIVVLFNGFQKKSQKTPKKELKKALIIKEEYFNNKNNE